MLSQAQEDRIASAVDHAFEAQIETTKQLVSIPSTRGAESPAQDFMADRLRERDYAVDDWMIEKSALDGLPDVGVIEGDFSRARTVVGTLSPRRNIGHSLILQGHCDVVPAGPSKMWKTPPFRPTIDDDWMYGRGAADMKAGTIAALYAIEAIKMAGFRLSGRLHFQSVIEEESTGIGALSALQRGYRADCALLPEPTGQTFGDVCLGVIWFRLRISGEPTHVASATEGSNAIKAACTMISALEELEREWNVRAAKDPIYGQVKHPINCNPGIIRGGDWASSVPAWCDVDCRIALLPDWSVSECQREIETCVAKTAASIPFLTNNPPEIVWSGYLSHGYVMREQPEVRQTLERAHRATTRKPLSRRLATSLNDARFYDRYFNIPAFCYGPIGERIHGFNERVNLTSLRETTKALAFFTAEWCGLDSD